MRPLEMVCGSCGHTRDPCQCQACPPRCSTRQPPPQTLARQLLREAALGGLSPGVTQRGRNSDTCKDLVWHSLTFQAKAPRSRLDHQMRRPQTPQSRPPVCPGLPPNRQLEGTQRAANKEGAPQGGGREEAAPGAPTPQARGDGVPGGRGCRHNPCSLSGKHTHVTPGCRHHCPRPDPLPCKAGAACPQSEPAEHMAGMGQGQLQPLSASQAAALGSSALLRAGAGGDPAMRCFPAPRLGWGSHAVSRGSQGIRTPSGDRDTGEDSPRGLDSPSLRPKR